MSNENNISNHLIKVEPGENTRSTSLDMQLWSHAWEEAYLSLQVKPNAETRQQKPQERHPSSENEISQGSIRYATTEVTAPGNQYESKAFNSSSIITTEQSQTVAPLVNNPNTQNTFSTAHGLANAALNIKANNPKAAAQITQNIKPPNSAKTELAKSGFHVYIAENGEIKVWMRNQALNEKSGFALLQKLRDTFSQLGYTLAHFSLNGESVFSLSDKNTSDPDGQIGKHQPFIDKSY